MTSRKAGFNLNINRFSGLRNATAGSQWQSRENPSIQIEDSLTWLKGSHSFSFGGSFTHIGLWDARQTVVPQIDFGLATGDAALGMFTAANFPGASAAQITSAQNLYAVLTGRVNAINASVFLDENTNQYGYLAPAVQRGQLHEFGFSAQDAWRVRKDLTINYGVRYEVQLPFTTRNNSYSTASVEDVWGVSGVGNLFQPGVLTGQVPTYERSRRTPRPTTPTGTTSRRASAWRIGQRSNPACCGASWGKAATRCCAEPTPWPTAAMAWGISPACSPPIRDAR